MRDLPSILRLLGSSIVACAVVYPLTLLLIGQVFVPGKAEGSLILDADGIVVGSSQIAQIFTQPGYFWPRPSAVNFDAGAAGGSNLSPANPALRQRVEAIQQRYQLKTGQKIPSDLVSASGSGLDPHITLDAALFQAPRVAASRRKTVDEVVQIVEGLVEYEVPEAFADEPLINVLALNLALDRADGAKGAKGE